MRSLRATLLLGILAANFAALGALAVVVLRDVDRRREAHEASRLALREAVVRRVQDIFVSFLSEIDFEELESGRRGDESGFIRRILSLEHWTYVRDAYIASRPYRYADAAVAGRIELNPLGAPDRESEARRRGALLAMAEAFESGEPLRRDDIVVIPLYGGGARGELRRLRAVATELAAGTRGLLATIGDGGVADSPQALLASGSLARFDGILAASGPVTREPWGAAYIRVAIPEIETVESTVDVLVLALAIGGATLLAITSTWLLLRRLVLDPMRQMQEAAAAVASGALATRLGTTGDSAEMDALITAFNRMTEEIAGSRVELERRVEEALTRARVTEKRLVLSERLAAMGTLASGIAHEINNPLGGMLNAVKTLEQRAPDDPRTKRYLALVDDGLSRIRDVVQRVLRFSPSRSRRGEIALAAVIDDALRFVSHRVRERGVEVEVAIGSGLVLVGDAPALGQVILNLLINAVDAFDDAVPRAPRRIAIAARAEGEEVVLEIEDNGPGMPKEVAERAFDLFFTTKAQGTGLGLSIAHQIVSEHGGTIAVESEPAAYTRFVIRLPRAGA
jgi:signal transduction histidine kinase